jgi:hypothetical protein
MQLVPITTDVVSSNRDQGSVGLFVCLVVFSATFNDVLVISISWRSVVLVEETGVPEKAPTCRKSLKNFIT